MENIAERITARLTALRKNPSGVALEAGLARSSVRDILQGRALNPRIDTLKKLAIPLECTLDFLVGLTDDPSEVVSASDWSPVTSGIYSAPRSSLELLEAGVFRSPKDKAPSQNYAANRTLQLDNEQLAYADDRLPHWQTDKLYMVGDASMSDHGILPNDVITAAAHSMDLTLPLTDGLFVIVKRSLKSPAIEELSLRRVVIQNGHVSLACDGHTGAEPIELRKNITSDDDDPTGNIYSEAGDNNSRIQIIGVAVRITRSLPLSNEMTEISSIRD